ncbi:MAG: type II CRISPR RNA-guided endonuclease Cas9 [Alphaproteobacteria bacterium]
MAKIIFSFDLGTTSIGWGVTQAETKLQKLCFGDADQFFSPLMPYKILGAGVRIFDEPRDPKSKQPINVARRTARLARRVIRRRRQRKAMLREILCEYGFLPKLTLDPHGEWQRVMGSGNDHDRNGARETVFALRAAALDHGLSAFDLGRVLYHMASHRQFSGRDLIEETEASKKPQNKEMQAQAKEEQKANQVREATASILEQEKISFGEYLSRLAPDQKKRGKLSDRVQIENEFLRIIETQMVYHPSLKHISAQLQDIIFAQKPVFWRLSTLGSCVFHPDHPLLMKGSWLACQKRMLENLNNLRVEQDNYRPLSSEEREIILNLLQTSKGLSFAAIRKALKFHKTTKFNLEVNGGLKQMPGNPIEASLYEIFGEQWQGHTQQAWLRDNLQDFLFSVNYQRIGDQRIAILGKQAREAERKKFIKCLIEEKGLKTDQAEAIGNIKLMSGWEPYSKGAMMSFLPKLEAGHAFGSLLHSPEFEEWRNDAFPNRIKPTGELYNLLPSPNQTHQGKQEMRYLTSLRNPTLQRTLNQLRKVVNNLIREYGKPDLIRLESTRNLSLGARDKDALEKSQNRQEKARNEAKNLGFMRLTH